MWLDLSFPVLNEPCRAPNYALSFLCQVPFKYILCDLNAIVICARPRLMKSWLSVEWLVTFGKPCAVLITVLTALCDDLGLGCMLCPPLACFALLIDWGNRPCFWNFVSSFSPYSLSPSLRTDSYLCCTLCQIQTPWWVDSVLLISIQFYFLQSHSYCPLQFFLFYCVPLSTVFNLCTYFIIYEEGS